MKDYEKYIGNRIPGILISENYQVLATNARFRDIHKVADKAINGITHCYQLSHGYSMPCHEHSEDCPLKRCMESGESQRALHIHQTSKGPEYCDIQMQPLRDENGDILGYFEAVKIIEHAHIGAGDSGLCGQSQPFRDMLALINRVAPTDVSVLLQGESGTGKELVASAIHQASQRSQLPFVILECTGLTESLFESELFGYVKGAFTGAIKDKPGLIDAANGGTLFLDEIGDIPLNLQVKLLRLLETGTYRPVGSVETRKANFRLLSATHKPLDTMVSNGEFRQDLFYRLAAFPIHLPPLRERRQDLAILVTVLLEKMAIEMGQPAKHLSNTALKVLNNYDFPGNIRELRNILQRALLMADDDSIQPQHLPIEINNATAMKTPSPLPVTDIVPLKELESRYLQQLVRNFDGSHTELAQKLGVSERTLYRKLKTGQ